MRVSRHLSIDPSPPIKEKPTLRGWLFFAYYRVFTRVPADCGESHFCIIKREFSYKKVRYRGLAKNTAQLMMLFALRNIFMARRSLEVDPEFETGD